MSTHPNTILMAVLTPKGDPKKTMQEILAAGRTDPNGKVLIGKEEYYHKIMVGGHDVCWKITVAKGDLVFLTYPTSGHYEKIEWDDLYRMQTDLDRWADDMCDYHNCTFKIYVTANYW